MRPRKLVVTAFGPFAGTVEVDFTRLEGRDLLLIEGPTGAGKTSLLDAMTYALFGAVPGARHEIETQLRSDFAEASSICEVSFDFALGERVYRVRRRPEQERARKRGGTRQKVVHKPEAHLFVLDDSDGVERPACQPKVSEVNAAVQQLLGLSVEQFKQVLLLPQGEFREFLLARSNEKEALLEKLFGTSLYKDVADRLGAERRTLERRSAELTKLQAEMLAQRGVDTLEALDAAAVHAAAQIQAAASAAEQAGVAARSARERYARAQVLVGHLALRERARAEAQLAEQAHVAAAPARALLADAERAEPVGAALAAVARAAERALKLERAAVAAAAALAAATRGEAAVAERVAGLPERRARLEHLTGRDAVLVALEPVAAELVRARAEHATTFALRKAQLARLAELDAHEARVRAVDAQLAERNRRAEAATADLAALTDAATAASARGERRRELAEAHGRAVGARHNHTEQQALVLAQRAQVDEARTAVERRREAREANLAAELAQGLRDGSPCPVCGSAAHPQPASPAAGAMSAEQVADAEKRHAQLAGKLAQADSQLAGLAAEVRGFAEREQALAQALAQEGVALETLDAALSAARTAVLRRDEARKAADELRTIARERQSCAAQLETLAAARREASEARAQADATLAALRTRGTELAAQVNAALPEGGTPQVARAQIAEQRRTLEGELGAILAEQASAATALAGARVRHEQAAEELRLERLVQSEAEQAALAAARAHGFTDAAQAASCLLPPEQVRSRREAQVGLERRRTQALDRLADAEAALAGADAAALTDAADAAARATEQADAERAAAAASEQLGLARAHAGELERSVQAARGRADELARADAELRVLGQLARVCAGDNPLKMSLGRFVLAARMEEVAIAASERLFAMSRGRYRLRRTDEVRHAGRGSGLDLVVDDSLTGSERPVHSLSGGEMFLASLSLAMGLADVVQAHAGGIRLDSLFIDEGFGSLDDDTLDQVMRTLEDLRAGGRLVGLISHVHELKERLSTRLTVVKGARGSIVRMVV